MLSNQAVSLLWSSTSSSSQANSTRRVNTNHGGNNDNNNNKNLWFAVGTATAASALAYKLFQERDRSVMVGFSLSVCIFIDDISGLSSTLRKPALKSLLNNFPSITEFASSPVQIRSSTISPPSRL